MTYPRMKTKNKNLLVYDVKWDFFFVDIFVFHSV